MKLITLTIMLLGSLVGQPDYEILVNGSSSSNVLYANRSNEIVIRGKDADKIRLTSTQAFMKRKANTYTLILKDEFNEILILATYENRRSVSELGYYKFQVKFD
jgi:hypothetical protein